MKRPSPARGGVAGIDRSRPDVDHRARGLVSPVNGQPLVPEGRGVLGDGERRWPVVAGIAWLRSGHDELRERAVRLLDRGDPVGAAVLLLADTDDWWDRPAPAPARLRAALNAATLRRAVRLLGMGRVGTYFLHRWSDPTWLAVLALTQRHPPGDRPVLELACGAGHLLRELTLRGHRDVTGIDIVFAKLWLARRFVAPTARLICADVVDRWPVASSGSAYVACHDALYFLAEKERVVRQARAYAGEGSVVLGHCHNALVPGVGTGLPLDPAGWEALLPGAVCYDDAELTAALLDRRTPLPDGVERLAGSPAMALVSSGRVDAVGADDRGIVFGEPMVGRALRVNPLYRDGRLRWPGERWRAEYHAAATYLPARVDVPERVLADAAAGRSTFEVRELVRTRVLLDLPDQW